MNKNVKKLMIVLIIFLIITVILSVLLLNKKNSSEDSKNKGKNKTNTIEDGRYDFSDMKSEEIIGRRNCRTQLYN